MSKVGRIDPDSGEDNLKKQIDGLIRSTRFISYRESGNFVGEIQTIHNQLEDRLHSDPSGCWRLTDKLVRADGKIFNRVDDSDGSVGDVFSDLCLLWLRSASLMGKSQAHWIPLVQDIHEHDDYGARNSFLQNAGLLLTSDALSSYYDRVLADSPRSRSGSTNHIRNLVTLQQLSLALNDPELYYQTELHFYPNPNNLQMLSVIKVFLDHNQSGRAREILEQTSWEARFQGDANRLSARAFKALGTTKELLELRRSGWERVPNSDNLQEYLDLCSPDERESARALALEVARRDPDLARGAGVLLLLGDFLGAEDLLIARHPELTKCVYSELLSLIDQIPKEISPASQTLLYRALLTDLLDRAYSKAYHHGARYLKILRKLAAKLVSWPVGVSEHAVFEAELLVKHGRKNAFWRLLT